MKNISGVKAISAGSYHSLALPDNGAVRSWCYNENGELGDGRDEVTDPSDYQYEIPVAVKEPGGTKGISGAKGVSAGYYFSIIKK